MSWTKNVAVTGFTFGLIHKITGDPVTTGTATGYRTINGGTQTALTNTPVHEGYGQWSVDLTAAEMNGEVIGLVFTHASAVACYFTLRTTSGGTNQVTMTVVDDSLNAIPDVDVLIYNSANTVYLTSATTSSLGIAIAYLDDGTYSVRLKKSGVSFTTPETLVVSGTTTDTFTGVAVSVGTPSDSDSCRIYTYCYDIDGSDPLVRITATAYISTAPYYADGKHHYSKPVTGTYDPLTGLLYWDIAQGASAKITVEEIGYKQIVTVPAYSSYLLSSL